MNTPDEIIAVVTAFKEGKKIEHREFDIPTPWTIHSGPDEYPNPPMWNFSVYEYRVRKEPRDFWIEEPPSGPIGRYVYLSEVDPINHPVAKARIIHVREVMPDK